MKNNIVLKNIGLIIILIINLSLVLTNHTLFGESQKSWVATKYFFDNFKFINLTFGPLYIFYQKVLLVFNFPVFVKLETIINSFFFIITMYFLLNIFFKKYETSLIIFCYLPNILLIESRLNLLAASFFLIYLYKLIKYKKTTFLPIELIIACLIGRTFLLLLLINFFIKFFLELKVIKFSQIYSRSSILKIFLIFFLVFSYFFQWNNSKNNHMLSETKYYPNINYKNPLEVGFFQFNNQYHANKKNIGNKDWYFTFSEIYEENNSLKKILLNKPNFLFEHIIRNVPQLIHNMSVNQIYSLSLKKMNNLVVNKKINYSIRIFLIIISFFL